jgi:hypothetical protein
MNSCRVNEKLFHKAGESSIIISIVERAKPSIYQITCQ